MSTGVTYHLELRPGSFLNIFGIGTSRGHLVTDDIKRAVHLLDLLGIHGRAIPGNQNQLRDNLDMSDYVG